jgi:hypothetical protein
LKVTASEPGAGRVERRRIWHLVERRRVWRLRASGVTRNIILPLIIVLTTAIAAVNHGPVRVYWSLGTFVAIFLTGLVNYNRDRVATTAREEAIRSKTDLATVLNDAGQPLVVALGSVTATRSVEDARREVAVLVDRAVSLAQTALGRSSSSRTRATFYRIEGNRLVRKSYHGWTGCEAPRRDFVGGRSDHENEAIRIARGENALLVKDLPNHPPPHFADATGRPYQSFVSVPVRAGNISLGLLTADADRAYALTEIEEGFMILIAGALGAGVAHVEAIESTGGG